MNDLLAWARDRLKEPSTYAGLGVLMAAAHVALPAWVPQVVAIAGPAIAGVIAVFVPEKKS